MSNLTKRRPEFTTSIRGYDRLQVDDYIDRLHNLLTHAERRAREAESELEFREAESDLDLSRHATIGPRVGQILDLAIAESKELRARIKQQSDALLARARREAEDIVESARAQAADTREQLQREREHALTELEAERQRAHAEIIGLQRRQTELLGSLRQLQEAVSTANLIPAPADVPTQELDRDEALAESPRQRPADTSPKAESPRQRPADTRILWPFDGIRPPESIFDVVDSGDDDVVDSGVESPSSGLHRQAS
jgi:DivIVA domain-containing protein